MRVVAIPVLCLLVLAGLAVLPTASAAPPTECNGTIGGRQTVGPVTVFVSPPCYDVYVDAMSCPLGNGEWTDLKVQNVGVHVYTCSEDPAAASAAPPCTCPPPPRCTSITTVGPISEIVSVTVTSDCRVIVAVLPRLIACSDPLDGAKAVTLGRITVWLPCGEISGCEPPVECYPASAQPPPVLCGPTTLCTEPTCPYPLGGSVDQTVGPVHVQNEDCGPQDLCSGPLRCTSPFDRASASAVLIPPVCIRKEAEVGAVSADVGQCWEQQVTVDACSGTGPGVDYTLDKRPVALVGVAFCFPHGPPPDLSVAASQPGPCGVQQRCPAPVPMCSQVNRLFAESPSYSLSDNCHLTINLEAYCGLQGTDYHSQTVSKVTVNYQTCQAPPPPQSAAMADPFPTCIRECTPPIVPDGCDLRAATPTTVGPFLLPFNPQQFVWGSDCDIDVDPIGACAPPSGRTLDAEVLFLDVSLLMCDGGLGDIADGWS